MTKSIEEQDCKHCGRPMTKEILDKKAKQKSDRIKEARKLAKLLGEPCGAVRKYDREKIIQLRAEGLTFREISKAVDCSTMVVSATLKEKNNQND